MASLFYPYFFLLTVVASLLRGANRFRQYRKKRGMSILHDWKDWLGGYPLEVTSVQELEAILQAAGFATERVVRTRGWGCNQLVLRRTGSPASA